MLSNTQCQLEALRADYRKLQSTASERVSAAVSRSTRIFSDISKPAVVNVRDSFDPRAIRKKSDTIVKEVKHSSPINENKNGDGMALVSAVPLIGESGDPETVFLNLVSELMRPRERTLTGPSVLSARASPAPSIATSRTSATTIRSKSVPPRPRGFGSSTARFEYNKKSLHSSFAERVKAASSLRRKTINSLGG